MKQAIAILSLMLCVFAWPIYKYLRLDGMEKGDASELLDFMHYGVMAILFFRLFIAGKNKVDLLGIVFASVMAFIHIIDFYAEDLIELGQHYKTLSIGGVFVMILAAALWFYDNKKRND